MAQKYNLYTFITDKSHKPFMALTHKGYYKKEIRSHARRYMRERAIKSMTLCFDGLFALPTSQKLEEIRL